MSSDAKRKKAGRYLVVEDEGEVFISVPRSAREPLAAWTQRAQAAADRLNARPPRSCPWRNEFPGDYDVPEHISDQLKDVSWSNDASPSFVTKDAAEPYLARLWCEHPRRDRRESRTGYRFAVAVYDRNGAWVRTHERTDFPDRAVLVLAEVTRSLSLSYRKLTVGRAAEDIMERLKNSSKLYAGDPARKHRGFHALHDLMDANTLLPFSGRHNSNDHALVFFQNAVIAELTARLCEYGNYFESRVADEDSEVTPTLVKGGRRAKV